MEKNNISNCFLKIKSISYDSNGEFPIEFYSKGYFETDENKTVIRYEETELTGYEGCTVEITAVKNEVTVRRSGKIISTLTINLYHPCICVYGTPLGTFNVMVKAIAIKNQIMPQGGKLIFEYELANDNEPLCSNFFSIEVKTRKSAQ